MPGMLVEINVYEDEAGPPTKLTVEDHYTVGLDGNVKVTIGDKVFYFNAVSLFRLGVAAVSRYLYKFEFK